MSTFATKYRPNDWKEVVGQEAVVRSLKAVLASGTSRTFLFAGPSGCGKTSLARLAAKQVGCIAGNIQEIDAAVYTGIEDMRQVTQALKFRPLDGTTKAIILNEAHRLSGNAWDSLLMSLEEPPPWVYWFLTTTVISKVPQAVLTRCTKYELKLLGAPELRELLEDVSEQEGLGKHLSEDDWASIVGLCAKEAYGSPRSALVNLSSCAKAKSKSDARELMKALDESVQGIDLARALARGADWSQVREILTGLKDQSPESVRQVIRAFVTTCLLDPKNGKLADRYFAILDAFSQPFYVGDGISPLVLAVGKLVFS